MLGYSHPVRFADDTNSAFLHKAAMKRLASTFCVTLCLAFLAAAALSIPQDASPDPPNDFTKIYYASGDNKLLALPFESGITSLNVFAPALEDKITRVRVNGSKAETVLTNGNLSFFVFVADRMDPPPHQLVRLTGSKSECRLRFR